MTLRRIALSMIVVAAFFIALGIVLEFLVDWLWFSTLGYLGVFLTIFAAKAGLFLVVFATAERYPGASAGQAERKSAPAEQLSQGSNDH